MKLTEYEEGLLKGEVGGAARLAMEVIVKLGELYGAEELLPISQAHIDGCLYAAVGEAGLEFAEKLHRMGGKVAVPTSLNATSRDIACWEEHLVGPEYAVLNTRMEQAYLGMGAVPTWTCAPYQAGLIPRFGEQLAWAESNAIVFANSVLGARTERYGDYTDICCALTGRAPKFGLHLKENRRGQVIFDCTGLALKPAADVFASLGYLVGKLAGDRIPVLTGLPQWTSMDHLKAFSAATASSGAVAMYHLVGITPEAPDLTTALQGSRSKEIVEITGGMLEESRLSLSTAGTGRPVDAVLLGCPHASAPEMMQLAGLLGGRKVAGNLELWVYTNRTVYSWLTTTGVLNDLKRSGVKIFRDTCFVNTDLRQWKFKTVMTNSAKYAHYVPSRTGMDVIFTGLEQCIKTALSGKRREANAAF